MIGYLELPKKAVFFDYMADKEKEPFNSPEITKPLLYDERLIELFKQDDNLYRAETYFSTLAYLGTPRATEFIIEQTFSNKEPISKAAFESIGHFPSDKIVLPLARKVFPEKIAAIPLTTYLLSEVKEQQRAELLKEIISSCLDKNEAPTKTNKLVGNLLQKSISAVPELKQNQEIIYPALGKAFEKGYGQLFDEIRQVFSRGGNKAIPTLVDLIETGECRAPETAVEILTEIDTKEVWIALMENQEKIKYLNEVTLKWVVKKGLLPLNPLLVRSLSKKDEFGGYQPSVPASETITFLLKTTNKEDHEQLVPVFAHQINNWDEKTAKTAVEALAEIGSDQAIAVLLETFKEKDLANKPLVKLIQTGHPEIVEEIVKMVKENREKVKIVLKDIEPKIVSSAIIKALKTKEADWNLAYLAQELGLLECLPALKELMAKERSRDTAVAIAKFGTSETTDFLIDTVSNSSNPDMREKAAYALHEIPFEKLDKSTPEQAKRLERLTQGQLRSTKQRVITVLITSAWTDPDPEVRDASISSLGEIGDSEIAELLWEKLQDEGKDIGFTASSAINKILTRERKNEDS